MDILKQARGFLEKSEPEKCLELALPIVNGGSVDDDIVLDGLHLVGEAYLEIGDPKNAYDYFSKCIELDPKGSKGGLEKFLWLGQLTGDRDGLKLYQKGLEGLKIELNKVNNNASIDELSKKLQIKLFNKKINEALCGMIEIWMTDLCMEPEAESQCEKLITEALLIDEEIPETWSVLGSIRISQQRNDDAKEALERSWELYQQFGDGVIEEIPSLIRLAQNMIEMGQYELVLDITKRIHIIDDQVVDAFYLNGLAHYQIGKGLNEEQVEEGKERIIARHIAGARDAWLLLLNLSNTEDVDHEMIDSVNEMLSGLPEVNEDDFSSSEDEMDEDNDMDDDDKLDLNDLNDLED